MDQLSSSETKSHMIESQTERSAPLGEQEVHPYERLRTMFGDRVDLMTDADHLRFPPPSAELG
ncbi:MAG: hypothetical protein KW788_00410 [Candidatus Doudnabacteria bacterium]|nr:hypothetical protein [Candidatus Doudnabacteria bacterium]